MEDFLKTQHGKEIILRGTYLSMAADVEWILLMILAQCFKENEQDLDNMYDKALNKFSLFEKIGAAQLGLIRYYPIVFKQHMDDFKMLSELRDMRNSLGHGKIDWDENDTDIIWISETTPKGIEKKDYKYPHLFRKVENYRVSVMNFLNTIKDSL